MQENSRAEKKNQQKMLTLTSDAHLFPPMVTLGSLPLLHSSRPPKSKIGSMARSIIFILSLIRN